MDVGHCICQALVRRSNTTTETTKTTTADVTALRSVRLSFTLLNDLAVRGSSNPWWGAKRKARPGIDVW